MSLTTEKLSNGDGSTTTFTFPFKYVKEADVKVTVGGQTRTQDTHYTLNQAEVIFKADHIPPAGTGNVRIFRDTDITDVQAEFFAGSAIRAQDLNSDFDQNLFKIQELNERVVFNAGDTMTGPLVLDDTTLQITEASDTLTIAVPALTANHTVNFTDVSGNIVTTGDSGTVSRAMLAADAINAGKIADNSIDSEHYVDGSIDREHLAADIVDGTKIADDAIALEHMSANSVDSDQYVDGSIDLIHMSANSVDSDQYVDGSIDRVHLAADIINGSKIADDAVDSEHIKDGAIDLAHMSANSVDSDQYVDGSIDNAHLAHNSVDSDQYVDRSIDTIHIGLDQVTYAEMQDISTDHRLLGRDNNSDGTITEVQVATDMVVDDAITSAKLADHATDDSARAVTTNHIKNSAVTSAKIADDTIVNADIKSDAAIAGTKINMSLNQLSDVNVGTPGSGQDDQVLAWDNANSEFALTTVSSGGGGGISDVSDDSTPQLGGPLDVNGNEITSASNGNIVINPHGTGTVELGAATTVSTGNVTLSAGGVSTTGGASVFNEGGGDFDFRVEGDGSTHLLFVDAQNDRVAINTSTTQAGRALTVAGDVGLGNGNTLSLMASSNNNTAELGYHGSISYVMRLPVALPTNTNRFLRATGNTSPFSLEFAEVDTSSSVTTQRLVNSTSTNTFTIAANTNVGMVGPLTINGSNSITVPSTSTFKIL